MRWSRAACLTAALSLACGDDGLSELSVDQVNGAWRLALEHTESCVEPVLDGTYYVDLAFAEPGSDGNTATSSHWTDDPSAPNKFDLEGTLNTGTGTLFLVLWQDVQVSGAILNARISQELHLIGTAGDPRPGYTPVLSAEGCSFAVGGRKT